MVTHLCPRHVATPMAARYNRSYCFARESTHAPTKRGIRHELYLPQNANDTKPQNWKHKDQLAADYKNLIGQFAKLPSKPRIFICRPVPVPGSGNWGINEAGVKEEIPVIDKVAEETASGVIDMHAALADHAEVLPDRVHPNTAGAMARAACKALTGKEAPAAVPPVKKGG